MALRVLSGIVRWAPLWCLIVLGAAAFCLGRSGPHGLAVRVMPAGSAASSRTMWTGMLWVDRPITRIGVTSASVARLSINGAIVIETEAGPLAEHWAEPALLQGANHIALDYEPRAAAPAPQLRWVHDGAVSDIDSIALSPESLTRTEQRARRWAGVALWMAIGAWIGLLASALTHLLRRFEGAAELLADRRVIGALTACFVLFVVGITWGWPGSGWPPDELDPAQVLNGWHQRFSGGWYDKYPPVFFYLLTLVYAPVLAAEHFHRASTVAAPVQHLLYLSGRMLSLLFSMGTVAAIGLLAARLGHRRDAWLAVLLAGAFLPMAFYAKTANLEATYVFWFVLSLVLFAGADSTTGHGTFVGIGAAAALAVATKDQAYSLYVLPAAYVVGRSLRGGPQALRPLQLITTAVSALVAWSLAMNVVFNADGVREHVRTILGPASSDYRVFDANATGQVQLFMATSLQLWQCLAWAGMVAVVLGVRTGSRRPLPPWLWLTVFSSYLCFSAIVGYSYDRFLLPLTLVCTIPAAVGIAGLLRDASAYRWKRLFGWVLLVWIVMRPVGLDVLMVTDARYTAEAWLRQHVGKDETVGSAGQLLTLPRMQGFNHLSIRPGIDDTLQKNPDYVIVNTEHLQRYASDPMRMAWLAWLQSGKGPYREVFRHKSPVPWYSPLRLDWRFTDRLEAPFTNLDKMNPEIAIFQRQ